MAPRPNSNTPMSQVKFGDMMDELARRLGNRSGNEPPQTNFGNLTENQVKDLTEAQKRAMPILSSYVNNLRKMSDAYESIRGVGAGAIGIVEELSRYGKGKFDPIQEAFGGLADIENITNKTTRSVVDAVDKMYQTNLGLDRAFMVTRNGEAINAADVFFKNANELANSNLRLRENLAQDQTLRLNEMTDTEQARLAIFQKGLRLSNTELSEVMRRQIALTGKASNEIFTDISKFSSAVSSATGISFQEVSDGITQIITDVKRFGNVQADEAARIVGHLAQMGVSYQSFGGMVDKFMNFDSAAESLGNLTTVFGIHFDAMEMMQLANEDQEEFLIRMREAFLDSGRAIEDMTLAEKRLAAQQMGMSIEDFENFMQEDRELKDLTAATEAASAKSTQQAFQEMTEQMAIQAKTLDERSKYMRERALEPLSHEAYRTGEAFEIMKGKIFLDPDKFLPGYTEARVGIQETYRALAGSDDTFNYTALYLQRLEEIKNLDGATGELVAAVSELEKKATENNQLITAMDVANLALQFPNFALDINEKIASVQQDAATGGFEAGKVLGDRFAEGLAPTMAEEKNQIAESVEALIGEVDGSVRNGMEAPERSWTENSLPPIGETILGGLLSGFDLSYIGSELDSSIAGVSDYVSVAATKSFTNSGNPMLEALASGEGTVDVAVSTDSAIGSISQAVEASSEKAETTEREAQAKRDEQHKEVLAGFAAMVETFQQFAEKENIIDFKAYLETDVIAQKLVRWRGSGGTTSFEVKAG